MGKIPSYTRLSIEERERIASYKSNGFCPGEIADKIGRHRSTITRELADNKQEYLPIRSHRRSQRAMSSRRLGKLKIFNHPKLFKAIKKGLAKKWSPEQISCMLPKQYPQDTNIRLSHESIYRFLYLMPKGELKKYLLKELRREHKHRRKRNRLKSQEKPMEDMVLIDQRPKSVDSKEVPGHWEGDLLIGKNRQSQLGVLRERKTVSTILIPLKDRRAKTVRLAFAREINKLPLHLRKSLTYDQGREMAEHKQLTKQTNMKVYFAHPGCPWEKGGIENTNGLIRQYFPKGTDFGKVKLSQIRMAQRQLNSRPRKMLNWETPAEVFSRLLR